MKFLPDAGPQRSRLILMISALVVIGFAYYKWGGGPELVIPQTTGPLATSKPAVTQRGSATSRTQGSKKNEPTMPQALKLKEMEEVPDEPEAGRNLFRFGVHPLPPQPKPTPLPPPPPYVAPPPPVPQIPPIPLKLTLIIVDDAVAGGKRAYLSHKDTGATFEAFQGQIVDGRYKLLAVGTSSVVMCYLDGTGQRTIQQGGS